MIKQIAENLTPFEQDCATTVMLKISDDSCKMDDEKRALFVSLYDAMPLYQSEMFDLSVHDLIMKMRSKPDALLYARVKKEREMAMAIITQERMKAFKASIRSRLLISKLAR